MSKDEIMFDAEERMEKALVSLDREFTKLRTGRASPSLVDEIKVDYYGTPTAIKGLATISIPDSRTISIQPWDKGSFAPIEKAIQKSELGLNPMNDGKLIRIVIPALTEERRKELSKLAKKYGEDAKIAIRNIRRDANDTMKKLEKEKSMNEDECKKAQDEVQKMTDKFVAKCDEKYHAKEKEIMDI